MVNAGTFQGIGFGLGTALCQSIFYLVTRRFVGHTGKTPLLLLIVSHVIMGAMSVVLLATLRPRSLPPLETYLAPLAGAGLCYLAAQFGLFSVLRHVESSRVSPLLGGKIVVLALFAVTLTHQDLRPLQWLAVGLSAGAAWLLNEAGGRVPVRCLCLLGLTIMGYCLSDLSIGVLMQRLAAMGPSASVIGAALTYALCGAIALPFVFRRDARDLRVWTLATPCACAWLLAMCLLYACFGLIGVVFGNIVQATRGIISVALGWAVARVGHTHLESHASRRVFWRRAAGAALMMLAVALYLCGRRNLAGA